MATTSVFDATPSLLGYMHQLRYALWQGIEACRDDILGTIAIEAADDVELVTTEGHRVEQLKHRDKESSVSDRSSDLWKTIRIWSSLANDSAFDMRSTAFRLITTGKLREGSIASLLTDKERDPLEALVRLRKVATEQSDSNGKAYEAFNALPAPLQKELVSRIEVIAQSPDIDQVASKIERSLALGFPREHLATFAKHIEGWWYDACIKKLQQPGDRFIHLDQLDAQIHAIREEFSSNNLPISRTIARLKPAPVRYQNHDFVKQLHFIKVNEDRINRAITNYLRAFNQRSAWQRGNLLLLDELEDYADELVEEWSIHFDQLRDALGEGASEEARISAARDVYSWAEGATSPVIRDRCTERFVVRGSIQILANEGRVGWHPDFAEKLLALLDTREGVGAR